MTAVLPTRGLLLAQVSSFPRCLSALVRDDAAL